MCKVMKDRYIDVKAQVLYALTLSRKINVSQGTGKVEFLHRLFTKYMSTGY